MLNIQIRPITQWHGKENDYPQTSRFKCGYKVTLGQLEDELAKANYVEGSVVIEMFIDQSRITMDGTRLRADAKPFKEGIILRFSRWTGRLVSRGDQKVSETQDISYPCDAFDAWQDNLRAVALSMESLRRVERYGVFKYDDIISRLALPSAEGKVSTKESAAAFLAQHSGVSMKEILFSDTARATAYRKAAHALHPDKTGGVTEDFVKLTEANKVLTTTA